LTLVALLQFISYRHLSHQKKTNYALNTLLGREEFVKEVLTGLTAPPSYFPQNVPMNIQGYDSFGEVMERGRRALTPDTFEAAAYETQEVIIDTRPSGEFIHGFVLGSTVSDWMVHLHRGWAR